MEWLRRRRCRRRWRQRPKQEFIAGRQANELCNSMALYTQPRLDAAVFA